MVAPVIRRCGLPLSKCISFSLLVNAALLNIVDGVVSATLHHLLGCLVVYFLFPFKMSSKSVTTFDGIFIDGGFVPKPVRGSLLLDPEVCPDVGNGSSDMSSNISVLNEVLKCILLMLS